MPADAPPPVPLVSIVVPAYNAERFLAATLQSIRDQVEGRWDCVVVDDGSEDATAEIAHQFAAQDQRFRVLRQPNRGASAARNVGFRQTHRSSRYVTFMDSDDVWLPEALETLLSAVQATPGAIGSHGLAEFIDGSGAPLQPGTYSIIGRNRLGREGRRLVVWPLDRPTTFDVLINGNVLFPPGLLLVRRSAYEAAGPFDETFHAAEDWDMLIRLSRFGEIAFVNDVVLQYRRHERNLGAHERVPEQAWRVRCKAFYSPENSPQQRRAARRGWRAYQRHLMEAAWTAAADQLRHRRSAAAVSELLRLGVLAIRYARGRPLPRVTSTPLRW